MKRYMRRIALLVAALLMIPAVLISCAKPQKWVTHSLDYFDTATTITGYEVDREEFDRVSAQVLAQLGEYHRLYTIYSGEDNLRAINALQDGVHPVVTVDSRIIDMLLYAKEMYTLTGGRVNVAMGSVLSIWHNYRQAGLDEPWAAELPPMELLLRAAQHTDIEQMIIDPQASTVWLADPEMTLDVGAIAKGYAVEMVAQALEAQGISGYVINVGGNVRTVGTKPDGEPWLAGIENPNKDAEPVYIEYLKLAGESVVTSGSYQRYYMVGNQSYHHIIDSQTLMPAQGYLSVSVVCKSSALGDALSTALFCMPLEEGMALVNSLPDVEVLWVMQDETVVRSEGFERFVTQP